MGLNGHGLIKAGLTNHNSDPWESLCNEGFSRDRRATYCSSMFCNKGTGSLKGKIVFVGNEYKERCPRCGSTQLVFDTVTPRQAEKFFEQKNQVRN